MHSARIPFWRQAFEQRAFAPLLLCVLFFFTPTASMCSRAAGMLPGKRQVIFRFAGTVIKDSKWGKIPAFQLGLSEALKKCHKRGILVDGAYGLKTRNAIISLLLCHGFENLRVPPTSPLYGAIDSELWDELIPSVPLPTVSEKAFVLSLSFEGTDYDQAQWNYGTSDDSSALTWGPFGATVGYGHEIQAILNKIYATNPQLLRKSFTNQFGALSILMADGGKAGHDFLRPVFSDPLRSKMWIKAFSTLGAYSEVRDSYNKYAFNSGLWLKPTINTLYSQLLGSNAPNATAVDYAFFLDNAIHMTVSKDRMLLAAEAIRKKQNIVGRSLSPGERRRAVSLSLIPSKQKLDRLGRDVVYYIDSVDVTELSAEERYAWKKRSGFKASDFGLSDTEPYYPDLLK